VHFLVCTGMKYSTDITIQYELKFRNFEPGNITLSKCFYVSGRPKFKLYMRVITCNSHKRNVKALCEFKFGGACV
jgi:hypothetical protein